MTDPRQRRVPFFISKFGIQNLLEPELEKSVCSRDDLDATEFCGMAPDCAWVYAEEFGNVSDRHGLPVDLMQLGSSTSFRGAWSAVPSGGLLLVFVSCRVEHG